MRVILMLMVALGCMAQDKLYLTQGEFNGLFWRDLDKTAKLTYVAGFRAGTIPIRLRSLAGSLPTCPTTVEAWETGPFGDWVTEIDSFYQNPVNLPLPIVVAVVHSVMKLKHATKEQLEKYRTENLDSLR